MYYRGPTGATDYRRKVITLVSQGRHLNLNDVNCLSLPSQCNWLHFHASEVGKIDPGYRKGSGRVARVVPTLVDRREWGFCSERMK